MVTLITGASTGIGAEFARQFAARGHDLVVVARSADRLDALAAQLREAHGVEVTVIADGPLGSPPPPASCGSGRTSLGLEIDVLVNNAGFGTHCDVADADPQRLEDEVELNCRTLVGATARYLPQMRARVPGTIINIASTAAFQPLPKMAVYGATKAFVLSFTEALWAEEREHGIRVLAVCPGLTDTPFFELAGEAAASAASGSAALAFTRTPQQVVDHTMRAAGRSQAQLRRRRRQCLRLTRGHPGVAQAAGDRGVRAVDRRLRSGPGVKSLAQVPRQSARGVVGDDRLGADADTGLRLDGGAQLQRPQRIQTVLGERAIRVDRAAQDETDLVGDQTAQPVRPLVGGQRRRVRPARWGFRPRGARLRPGMPRRTGCARPAPSATASGRAADSRCIRDRVAAGPGTRRRRPPV